MFKFIVFLTLALSTQAFSKGFGQEKLNLSIKNTSLKKAFKQIEKISDYRFLYSDDALQANPATIRHWNYK